MTALKNKTSYESVRLTQHSQIFEYEFSKYVTLKH